MPSATESKVYFFYETKISLRERLRLKKFIVGIFKRHKKNLDSINYIFCTDKRLLAINQEYLAHDDYTDIISFELSSPGEKVQAEIYISVDRVRENAKLHDQSFTRELHRVIFHGALHICGFKDKTEKDAQAMRSAEERELRRYFA